MKLSLGALLLVLSVILSDIQAQKIEHGALVGVGAGFALQDDIKLSDWNMSEIQRGIYGYDNWVKPDGLVGYRIRFNPEMKSFYDLDLTVGIQRMKSNKYNSTGGEYYTSEKEYGTPIYSSQNGKTFKQFYMPISITGSWNYKISSKFFMGAGVSPSLYVSPNVAFDVAIMAKMGYRIGKRCELGLSYQYGCLNVMKHFNEGNSKGRRGHLSDLMFSVYVPLSKK